MFMFQNLLDFIAAPSVIKILNLTKIKIRFTRV